MRSFQNDATCQLTLPMNRIHNNHRDEHSTKRLYGVLYFILEFCCSKYLGFSKLFQIKQIGITR